MVRIHHHPHLTEEYEDAELPCKSNAEACMLDYAETQPKEPSIQRIRGSSSVDRALAFQAGGRGFEPRLPLSFRSEITKCVAALAQW